METTVVLTTALVTVIWSVRSYFLASGRLGMGEESPFRMVTIVAPSGYFLLLVFTGWQRESEVRIDLVGMLLLNAIAIVAFIFSFLVAALAARRRRSGGVTLFVLYHLLSVLVVAGTFVVRGSPALLFAINSFFRRLDHIELFSFAWIGFDSERQEQDIVSFLNRITIAALSYLPISILRFLTSVRHRRRMAREIEQLERRISAIEKRADSGDL